MSRILRLALLACIAPTTVGCKALLSSLADNGPWGEMLRAAPLVPNPVNTGVAPSIEVRDQSGDVSYRWSSFSLKETCFTFVAPYAPESIAATEYSIETLLNSWEDRAGYGGDPSQKASNSRVRVITSHSAVRMVSEYVRGLGMVEKPKEFHTTEGEVCFSEPKFLKPLSGFLLLYPSEEGGGFSSYAAWRFEPVAPSKR